MLNKKTKPKNLFAHFHTGEVPDKAEETKKKKREKAND